MSTDRKQHTPAIQADRDMFGDLAPLDPFEIKKEEIAAQMSALLVFAGKTRSNLGDRLGWKKSRVTHVLSGASNPTLRTVWEFAASLGYDVDLIFRLPHQARVRQPWQQFHKLEPAVSSSAQPSVYFTAQTPAEVISDLKAGRGKSVYLSFETEPVSKKWIVDEQPARVSGSNEYLVSRDGILSTVLSPVVSYEQIKEAT